MFYMLKTLICLLIFVFLFCRANLNLRLARGCMSVRRRSSGGELYCKFCGQIYFQNANPMEQSEAALKTMHLIFLSLPGSSLAQMYFQSRKVN